MKVLLQPTRLVALGFLLTILLGTAALMLPVSRVEEGSTSLLTALFTATSAVCVTGLAVVDTGTYWSTFGHVVIMLLIQAGGFGMMTAATLLGLMVNRSLRLRMKLTAQVENHAVDLGDVTNVSKVVLIVTFVSESLLALVLMLRLNLHYDMEWGQAAWYGVFHSISAFNNAGFAFFSDSLMSFSTDAWILLPVATAIAVGGIGFPVIYDLGLRLAQRRRHASLHTKLTLVGTAAIITVGVLGTLLFEWNNPNTLGPMSWGTKILNSLFAAISARTAGFNAIDIGAMSHSSWGLHYLLMFIGAGSAGTAGGVKIGTAAILLLIVIAEIRGANDVQAFGRRIASSAQRQAVTVLVLSSALIVTATVFILQTTPLPTDQVIFEVISAFGTVGLSTGITSDLPPSAQLMLTLVMYTGRVGTITLAASLAMNTRPAALNYRYPEEYPIVG